MRGKIQTKGVALLLLLVLLCGLTACGKNGKTYTAQLYFLNEAGTNLETESREIPINSSTADLAKTALQELIKGPAELQHKAVLPAGTALKSISVNGNAAEIDFNEKFVFEKEIDALFARTAVVSTLCEIPGIERVRIRVNGGDLLATDGTIIGELSKEDIIYDSQLGVADYRYVTLYFADENAEYLIPESRTVVINVKESLEYVILNELIKGPKNEGAVATVPNGTRIISVETKDGTCYVNLSKEFKEKHVGGTSAETMTIYSIVNTLTELETVENVQFLIEGQKVDSYIHFIFNEPFNRDKSLIKK